MSALVLALAAGITGIAGLVGAASPSTATPTASPGPAVSAHAPSLYPEGVAWDPTRRAFLVGSARRGTVSVVRPDGTVRTLVRDPRLVSTFGLTVDTARGRLLVTYADLGFGERSSPETERRQSGLGIYDLASGAPVRLVDLGTQPGPHAANDVTVDRWGTAYVTDVLGDAIYRVSPDGHRTGVIRDPRFVSDGFGMNGIVWHPEGYLLTVRYDTGTLFRVSPDGRRVDTVALAEPLVGGDGLALRRDGSLVVVTNTLGTPGVEAVRVLRARPGWRQARQVRTVAPWPDHAPTTAASTSYGTYVLSGGLDALLAGDATRDEFTLRRL